MIEVKRQVAYELYAKLCSVLAKALPLGKKLILQPFCLMKIICITSTQFSHCAFLSISVNCWPCIPRFSFVNFFQHHIRGIVIEPGRLAVVERMETGFIGFGPLLQVVSEGFSVEEVLYI